MFLMAMSPSSTTVWPSSRSRSSIPAIRMADGPMSTPRRPGAEVHGDAEHVDDHEASLRSRVLQGEGLVIARI